MARIAKLAVRWALVLMILALLAQAQVGTSTLTGRVTDPTGAVAAGVAVTITNTVTNFRFSANTNEEGLYRVLSLHVSTRSAERIPGLRPSPRR